MTETGDAKRDAKTETPRGGVQSVAIAAQILQALAAAGGVLPLKDIALRTGMGRAKVHRYLATLRATGLVLQNPETSAYQIGPAAVTIGLVGLRRLSPIREIHDSLPRLRDRINETVTAAVWSERGPTVTAMEESDHIVTMNVRVGSVLPVLTTAIGRLFMTYLTPAETQRLVAAERQAHGARADLLPSEKQVAQAIAEIRLTRLSRARTAPIPGIDAVAAPVFDYQSKMVAAICVVANADSMEAGWPTISKEIRGIADGVSKQLGFVDDSADPRTSRQA